MNEKVYIHEFIDITRHNRAKYVHHMTANWSPIAQEERNQLCFGVWGVVGTTGRWPMVVNIWEEDGFEGLARSLGHETGHPSFQDEKLDKWWAEASSLRSGGVDRVLVPAPWSPTITQLCDNGVRGEVYAHEQLTVERGSAREFLQTVHDEAVPAYAVHGLRPVGAFHTAMGDESECILVWAIPTWKQWADFETAALAGAGLLGNWRRRTLDSTLTYQRVLMTDAPLAPLRTGRQPTRDDRTHGWSDL